MWRSWCGRDFKEAERVRQEWKEKKRKEETDRPTTFPYLSLSLCLITICDISFETLSNRFGKNDSPGNTRAIILLAKKRQ